MDIMKYVISYGLLLLVVLIAVYFSRGPDLRNIFKPVIQMNPH